MSEPTSAELLTFLRENGFLSAQQTQQLSASGADSKTLTRDLVARGWLSTYQANQLVQGRGAGLVLGPYRVLDKLGEGGMGQVFKAQHVGMDRVVALKVIPVQFVSNPVAVERFRREVRAVAKLSHANIVTAFDVGQSGETHYMAMEHLDGIDLAKLVQQSGPVPISNACEYVRQAAVGLQHAHERGLVHRDIKPGNLMVVRPGPDEPPVIKILDFGLARVSSETPQGVRLTQLGKIVGTVDYIAPEQAQNAQTADIRADVYSLGCMLFYLLTARPPFLGESHVTKLGARILGDVPSVRKVRAEVSPALEGVVGKMMATDPAARYQTPGEVAKALEPFCVNGKPARNAAPAADKPAPAVEKTAPGSPFEFTRAGSAVVRPPRSRPGVPKWVWIAGGAAAAAVVVAIVIGARWPKKAPDGSQVVEKNPGGDKPKDSDRKKAMGDDSDPKKDKGNGTERPAPLPRLVALPKLTLPARGSAHLDVQVDRQGYVGPIALRIENLPPGVTCSRTATVPAGESTGRLDFTTDGTAAEGATAVEVIALADAHTADRQALALVIPAKELTVRPQEPPPLPKDIVNSIGMRLRRIPAGEFLMGSPDSELGRGPEESLHKVRITRTFYMGAFEVTQGQYQKVAGTNPARHKSGGPDYPIDCVTWEQAQAFCKKLSDLPDERAAGRVYRLPTEAEWEYACRGGTATPFHFGASPSGQQARFNGAPQETPTKVGSFPPNAFGLYDMHGNVWEWCDDYFSPDYYKSAPLDDPRNTTKAPDRVLRGGSFNWRSSDCRAASRAHYTPDSANIGSGFRVVFTDPEERVPVVPTTWKSLANMPTARSVLAAVTGPDGRIYAIGGLNAGGSLGTVEVYDPSTNKWTTVAPMPTARNHLAAAVGPDNLIYALGGVDGANVVEVYNPNGDKWTKLAPMPTSRHGLAAVTGPDGRIYAIGGNGPGGTLNTVEAYDTKSHTWTTVAPMPTARVYLAAAMGPDGRIYAIGGFQERGGKRLNTVEAYDTKANKWITVANIPTARNALAAATAPDGRIYAIGGHSNGGTLNVVEAYEPSTNKWTTVVGMLTVRGQLAASTGRDGRIYAIGGGGTVPFLNTVEALSVSSRTP